MTVIAQLRRARNGCRNKAAECQRLSANKPVRLYQELQASATEWLEAAARHEAEMEALELHGIVPERFKHRTDLL